MTGNWARSFSLFLTPVTPSQWIQNSNNEEFMMFSNDGDLPSCDVIVANFLGSELDGVKVNDNAFHWFCVNVSSTGHMLGGSFCLSTSLGLRSSSIFVSLT